MPYKNPEDIKKWYRKNKKRVKQNLIDWRNENREAYNEYMREYMTKVRKRSK